MATILGIESTCDETAAAVVADGYDVRSNVVASQAEIHAKYRGVVPEIASRAHIENLWPVLSEAGGGDRATRRHGDTGTERPGEEDASSVSLSPSPLVPLSLSSLHAVA